MLERMNRRRFIKTAGLGAAGLALGATTSLAARNPNRFKISLGEYSLHRALAAGELDHLNFAKVTKETYGIGAVEFWSGPFKGKVVDAGYVAELKKRSADLGVKNLLILVDGEGKLGDPDKSKRLVAVDNHKKWLEGAKTLSCHSIRVNAATVNDYDEGLKLATDGLRRLSELGTQYGLNVIVENHGGLSSNGKWLAAVMRAVNLPNCGTLPDFGNFHSYDRYLGVKEIMPFAKSVSAKSHEFDDQGNEVRTDYRKMMKIVLAANYHGYVGIEYEGRKHSESQGIKLTKRLLKKVRTELKA